MGKKKDQPSCGTYENFISATSAKDKLKIRRSVMKFCKKMEARRHPQRKSVFALDLLKFVRSECPAAGVEKSDVERWITKCDWIWPARAYRDAPEEDDNSDSDSDLFTAVTVSVDKKSGEKRIVQLGTSAPSVSALCLGSRYKDKEDELTKLRRTNSSNQKPSNEPLRNQSERPRRTHNQTSFDKGLVRKLSQPVVESRKKRGRPQGSYKKNKVQKPKGIRKPGRPRGSFKKSKVQKSTEIRNRGRPRKYRRLEITNDPSEVRLSTRVTKKMWYRSIPRNHLNWELLRHSSICAKISKDRDSKLFRKCYVKMASLPVSHGDLPGSFSPDSDVQGECNIQNRSLHLEEEQRLADMLRNLAPSAEDDEVTYEFQLRLQDGVLPEGICLSSFVSAKDFFNGLQRNSLDFAYMYSAIDETDGEEVEIIGEKIN